MGVEIKKRGRPTAKEVKNLALKRAVDFVGGTTNLSLDIGVHPNKISQWLYEEQKIPAHHVPKIVKATQGVVKAHELRPDVFMLEEEM
jgi:DNA-binding transcriptional regulator YdaS (Cro superfamily)